MVGAKIQNIFQGSMPPESPRSLSLQPLSGNRSLSQIHACLSEVILARSLYHKLTYFSIIIIILLLLLLFFCNQLLLSLTLNFNFLNSFTVILTIQSLRVTDHQILENQIELIQERMKIWQIKYWRQPQLGFAIMLRRTLYTVLLSD